MMRSRRKRCLEASMEIYAVIFSQYDVLVSSPSQCVNLLVCGLGLQVFVEAVGVGHSHLVDGLFFGR